MKLPLVLVLGALSACGSLYGRQYLFDFSAAQPQYSVHGGRFERESLPPSSRHAQALVQRAESDGPQFNLALLNTPPLENIELRVDLEAIAGEIDQGGGLVWRARDAQNYYLARWNPLESNFRVYTVIAGQRQQLASTKLEAGGGWHRLRLWCKGPKMEFWFDGKSLLQLEDTQLSAAGAVGLWTKADAVTRFAALEVLEL